MRTLLTLVLLFALPNLSLGALIGSELITATIEHKRIDNSSYRHNLVKFEFGDDAALYHSSGISVTEADAGMRSDIISAQIIDQDSNGLVYKYDLENDRVLVFQVDGSVGPAGQLVELPDTQAVSNSTLRILFMGK